MPALETLLVTVLAPVVTKAVVGAWTGDANLVSDAEASIIDWAFRRVGDRAAARRAARPLERIGEQVVRDIQPLFERAGLDEDAQGLVVKAAATALQSTVLDASRLVREDLDEQGLAQRLLDAAQEFHPRLLDGFSEAEERLYKRVVRTTVAGIVREAARLPDWEVAQSREILLRLSEQGRSLHDIRQILDRLTIGLTRLPTDYRTRIRNFLVEYLGTDKQPAPFGGRAAQLAELDAWLEDLDAPPYALPAAEAGRGKSALLARWADSLVGRPDLHVVFVPLSIRFNTASEQVVFTALAAHLGAAYGEPVEWSNLSASQWRGVAQSFLAGTPPDGKTVLVVLDGLDEAADWQAGADLFPLDPPPGMRAVVSAHLRSGQRLPVELGM